MLLKQARRVYWKRWAAKHECVELKARVWLEPIQALLRRETSEEWTDTAPQYDGETGRRRRMGAGKIVRHWCSEEKKCRGCNKEDGTEKHRLYHVRHGGESETRS